jgi:hypothetical protein
MLGPGDGSWTDPVRAPMKRSGCFKGRSIFCPDSGDVPKYALAMVTPADVPGSRLLPTCRVATLQSGSPPGRGLRESGAAV